MCSRIPQRTHNTKSWHCLHTPKVHFYSAIFYFVQNGTVYNQQPPNSQLSTMFLCKIPIFFFFASFSLIRISRLFAGRHQSLMARDDSFGTCWTWSHMPLLSHLNFVSCKWTYKFKIDFKNYNFNKLHVSHKGCKFTKIITAGTLPKLLSNDTFIISEIYLERSYSQWFKQDPLA